MNEQEPCDVCSGYGCPDCDGTGSGTCERCDTTPADGTCCSSHHKQLCHLCYRRTHFVELCVAGCAACAREGLGVTLRDKVTGGTRG